jgi:prolipoprotein diacylglyceryl transferase
MSHFTWDFDPIALNLGPFQIHWYGICFALAITSGYYLMTSIFKKEGKNLEELDALLYYLVVGIIVGARLGHCLFYEPELYLSHPIEILKIWKGGLASHGAVVGLFLAVYTFSKKNPKFSFFYLFDRLSVCAMPASALIRLGNFFNSEIIGQPTQQPWGIIFKRRDLTPRHPSQLYEMVTYFTLFAILYLLFHKTQLRERKCFFSGLTLLLVFSARFLLEFFKTNQSEWAQSTLFSAGQWLSLPLILIGVLLIVKSLKTKKEV